MFDDLEMFKNWWLHIRPINTPQSIAIDSYGVLLGVVLYRQDQYQVQLFILPPDSNIDPHIHPNVDSFEVYIGGDIAFMCDDVWFEQVKLGDSIRVKPNSYHGGKFGPRGGCFLSVQKWLNGVEPSSVGADWHDPDGNTRGTASPKTPAPTPNPEGVRHV